MKHIYILILSGFLSTAFGQTKISFDYDEAGNQSKRYIVLPSAKQANPEEIIQDVEALTENDLLKDDEFKDISYYPNPVKEELFVKWNNTSKKYVTQITVYAISGREVTSLKKVASSDSQSISFASLPIGLYSMILTYSDNSSRVLKVAKQ
jgi:hypothetical protein